MEINIKKSIKFILLSCLLISTYFIGNTFADEISDNDRTCEEISQYFDPNLTEETGSASPNIKISCPENHHETFPGAHKQDKLNTGHPQPKKTTTQPISKHLHRYVHKSKEQININGKDIFYFVVVDKFEMQLQSDFMKNIYLNSVKCPNLPNENNCVGIGKLGEIKKADGTYTIGFITSFDKNKGTITWHFPGSKFKDYIPSNYKPSENEKWMKPMIDGNNPKLYKLLGSNFDPTPEENRMLERSINFETKDIQDQFWSATITSRILIKEQQGIIDTKTTSIDKFDSVPWKEVEHAEDESGEFNNYFWFDIGTTTTIWERPTVKPNICKSLEASLGKETKVNGKTAYPINVDKITFAPKNEVPKEAKLKWTSTDDTKGEFWKATYLYGDSPYDTSEDIPTFIKIGTGTVTTDINTKVYYIGQKPTKIKVELINIPKDQIGTNCYDYVFIPIKEEKLECLDLLVDHPKKVFVDTISSFKSKAIATNNQDWPEKIKYSVDPGHGEFYLIPPANKPYNTSKYIKEIPEEKKTPPATGNGSGDSGDSGGNGGTGGTGGIGGIVGIGGIGGIIDSNITSNPDTTGLDPTVIVLGNGANTGAAVTEMIGDLINGTYSGNISKYVDTKKAAENYEKFGLEAPEWLTSGIEPKGGPGPDPSPIDNNKSTKTPIPDKTNLDKTGQKTDLGTKTDFNKNTDTTKNIDTNKNTKNSDLDKPTDFSKTGSLNLLAVNFPQPDKIGDTYGTIDGGPELLNQPKPSANALKDPKFIKEIDSDDLLLDNKFSDSKTLFPSYQTLEVANNTPVFFWGKKAGTKKIHVQALNTTVPDCKRDFDIYEGPKNICLDLSYKLYHFGTKISASTLENNKSYLISASSTYTIPDEHTVTYTMDPKYGTFITINKTGAFMVAMKKIKELQDTNQLSYEIIQSEIGSGFTNSTVTVGDYQYVTLVTYSNTLPGKKSVLKMVSTGSTEAACKKEVDIIVTAPQNICTNLSPIVRIHGTTTPVTQLEKNKTYEVGGTVTYSPKDQINNITYTIDSQYGAFLTAEPGGIEETAMTLTIKSLQNDPENKLPDLTKGTIKSLPTGLTDTTITRPENQTVILVTYSDAPSSKPDVLIITATGSTEAACTKKFPFFVPEIVKECVDLSLSTKTGTSFEPKDNQVTEFKITGNYKDHNGPITVTTSTTTNNGTTPTAGGLAFIGTENYSTTLTFTAEQVKNSNNYLEFKYKRPDGYNPEITTIEISVKAIGTPAGKCEAKIVKGPTPPPPSEKICVDLDIIEPDDWEVEGDDDEQEFVIDVDTNPSSYENELYFNWKFEDGTSKTHWEGEDEDEETISEKQDKSQTLEDFDDDTEVTVWASTSPDGPFLKDANGNTVCLDSIQAEGEEEEEKPEISKYVFPTNEIKKLDNIINIKNASNPPYLTYMIIVDVGENMETISIRDPNLDNGKIKGNRGGSLDFRAMKIDILKDDDNEGKTILKTSKKDGYQYDYVKDIYGKSNYSDENFPDNKDDLEEYWEDYGCKKTGNFCIEEIDKVGKDYDDYFENIIKEFLDGEFINFKNVNKLGDNATIIIKYQMNNNTVITEDKCKELTAGGGCGEEFKNKAEFEAESESGKDYEDEDSSKVIAICPFILTRAGGDAFFHDLIDTGIDVSYCYEVKNCVGVCEKPLPPGQKKSPITGGGGTSPETLQLDLPSHDVCRYSNSKTNLKGYDDVLENFSSTICEIQADVAEVWTKKYINQAINANVTRISRWGSNLNLSEISGIDSLNVPNKESGIFVKTDRNLTISGSPYYTITSGNGIPAAQTYIVKNGDLYINSDIRYAPIDNYSNTRSIASAAFIVIDGDIHIGPDVKQIDGILIAIDLTNQKKGKIIQDLRPDGQKVEKLLKINGSLIGNVYDLFNNRIGVGDPRKDEGSVTIHYDERILLNTPPGITELLDIEQAVVPN